MDSVIIVAGGKGLRMGSDLPKQFLVVGGQPVLMRTIRRFHAADPSLRIVVVLPVSQQAYWRRLCADYSFDVPHLVADGGQTRFESSRNGLRLVPDEEDSVCGIHDGVRPFVSAEVIARCYATAHETGAAIPVMPVTDTLRYVAAQPEHSVLRSDYRIVQTPQVFSTPALRAAFDRPYEDRFTDDASVYEAMGGRVTMVEGNRENIKLTTPFDIRIAELLAQSEDKA